jgi:hypothetical protein
MHKISFHATFAQVALSASVGRAGPSPESNRSFEGREDGASQGNRVNGTSDFPAPFVDVSGAGVPARDAAGGGKGRPATLDQDLDAGFAGRRAGTPAPLFNFPFTRLPSSTVRRLDLVYQMVYLGL